MTSATERLRALLDERGVEWTAGEDECDRKTHWESGGLTWEYFNDDNGDAWLGFLGACEQDISPEQAVAATLGRGILTADDVRDLIERHSDASGGNGRDFHNGAYVAIADELNATLGETPTPPPPTPPKQPPYDELIESLRRDWDIEASWDGLRRFWYVGLTDEGVRKRDEREATLGTGTCHDEGDRWKYRDRMRELGVEVDEPAINVVEPTTLATDNRGSDGIRE